MIIYIPLASISFPVNVVMLYNILLPITSLDLIPPEVSTDLIFNMTAEEPYSDILENMGYESHNFIYNLGTMLLTARRVFEEKTTKSSYYSHL